MYRTSPHLSSKIFPPCLDTFMFYPALSVFPVGLPIPGNLYHKGEWIMPGRIRNSAKALMVKDGKMLAVKLKDSGGEFYIMPGGGQGPEELLSQAACREVAEETGICIECKDLLFVIEGAHGEDFHRVDLVFLCEYLGDIPGADLHGDMNQTGYDWLDIATLYRQPLYPSKLRRQIMNYCQGKPHKVYLGNEEMGDPECIG